MGVTSSIRPILRPERARARIADCAPGRKAKREGKVRIKIRENAGRNHAEEPVMDYARATYQVQESLSCCRPWRGA